MAYEVGAVRPGVGVNDGVTQFIKRRVHKVPWAYDHPLEKRALERTLGIILFQDQVNQVAIDVAGFSHSEADQLRRAFTRKSNEALVRQYWDKFKEGAMDNGVPEPVAQKIFKKFNGHYMFPESHAFAFGVTAYRMSWLKHYYPLEFFVGIFNQQPMGFYNLETLKEDARRYGVTVLNPDINASSEKAIVAPPQGERREVPSPSGGRLGRGSFGSPPLQRGVRGDFIRESRTAPQPLNPRPSSSASSTSSPSARPPPPPSSRRESAAAPIPASPTPCCARDCGRRPSRNSSWPGPSTGWRPTAEQPCGRPACAIAPEASSNPYPSQSTRTWPTFRSWEIGRAWPASTPASACTRKAT